MAATAVPRTMIPVDIVHAKSRRNSSIAPASRRASHRRVGGCSLDRNNNNDLRRKSKMLCADDSLHANEKIYTHCDSIRKLTSRSSFHKFYEVGKLIGQGNFSDVFLVSSQESSRKYAVKEIDKNRMFGKLYFVENEISILKRCDHRHICKLVDAFECTNSYFLVFEFASKGDLFEMIKKFGRLNEQASAKIVYQIASAISYLHSKNVVHRDIKPENILLNNEYSVKLTDFGLACVVTGPLYRICGTPTYVAPEILSKEGYGLEVDVWSLGILLHIMLVGFAPFRSADRSQLFRLIMKAHVSFDLPNWHRVSSKAKQLILRLVTPDVENRLTVDEVISDPWIQTILN
uniref:Protein kinase domain-containing protein n=1 Tax=Panagrellus redivivus TaxID=6233 RepID=A0A7E4WA86_PANRE